jgi:hypothetical protein
MKNIQPHLPRGWWVRRLGRPDKTYQQEFPLPPFCFPKMEGGARGGRIEMTQHILQNDSKIICSLLAKVNFLRELNTLFSRYIDAEFAKHCQVVKYEKNCLFVLVPNGHWTTQLRFQIPDLMEKLKKHVELKNLNGIICKARPMVSLPSSKKVTRKVAPLKPETAQNILDTAQLIKDTRLRKILEKIAKNLNAVDNSL